MDITFKNKKLEKSFNEGAQLEEILRFFGIASPEQWETVWREHQVAYRQSQKFATCAESVSAWLRQGAIQAQRIQCAPFNRKKSWRSSCAGPREKPFDDISMNAGISS